MKTQSESGSADIEGRQTTEKDGYSSTLIVSFPGTEDGRHAGTYRVRIGKEYRTRGAFVYTRRRALVEGRMVSINAMTNTDRYRQSDVIRDQQMLSERAVDVYVRTVLEPERKARDRCKRQQALKEALRSAQDWHVESSKTNVCIEPIGISVQLSGSGPDEPENRKRVALMERLIFLARRYGV